MWSMVMAMVIGYNGIYDNLQHFLIIAWFQTSP